PRRSWSSCCDRRPRHPGVRTMMFSQWFRYLHARGLRSAKRTAGRAPSRLKPSCRLSVERLEDRTLMAVSLTGVPSWVEQGPGPIIGGATSGLGPDNPVSGAVEAIAVRPGDPSTVFIGTTAGGIWRTNNINA